MAQATNQVKSLNYKLITTAIAAFLFGTALFIIAYFAEPDPKIYPFTLLIGITGCVLGWLAGILSAPYDKSDENKLGRFAKLVGTFLSGYVVSKLDRVLEGVIGPSAILPTTTAIRILLFICSFCLIWIVVYCFREYTQEQQ
ncbi:MAG: hypothetical protein J0I41_11015 [Filimonas sp.]|nr:hypothetical protein [Filimonas sp.]